VKHTALAALSAARYVGAEAGSVAVAAVCGSISAAGEIGNDLLNLLTQGGEKRP
jgi:hypothetical protein